MSRFAIRDATLDDVDGITRAHTASWQTSYRGILPDDVLERIDVGQRARSRRRILGDRAIQTSVAIEVSRADIVGFCDAGPARRPTAGAWGGEIYALYLEHHAKRHGLGTEMFERAAAHFHASGIRSLVIWVLEHNTHAHRFYDSMGGRLGPRWSSRVDGFPVVELAYVWDSL